MAPFIIIILYSLSLPTNVFALSPVFGRQEIVNPWYHWANMQSGEETNIGPEYTDIHSVTYSSDGRFLNSTLWLPWLYYYFLMTVMIIAVVTIQSSVPKKVIVSSSYIIISLSILFSSYVFFLLVKYHSLVESLLLWIMAWSNTTVVPPEIFVKRTGWKYINYCR